MSRFLWVLGLIVGMVSGVSAQDNYVHHPRCGHDLYKAHLVKENPRFLEKERHIIKRAKEWTHLRGGEVYKVPVVVHIVYKNEEQNIPDSTIQKLIQSVNRDFRHTNLDKDSIRTIFENLPGDAGIQFEVRRVKRVSTDATFKLDLFSGGLPDNVKKTSEGGSDAIDPSRFLNIWVCAIEGEALLGYSYPPAGLDWWPDGASASESVLDGVVVNYKAFTSYADVIFGGSMYEMRGRTLTHELGHYFGLRHIWGDGIGPFFGTPNCTDDDFIEDTPPQGLPSNQQCDPTVDTCTDDELPDMYENYMDYAKETCMVAFTQGQVAVMRGVLEKERKTLLLETSIEDVIPSSHILHPNPTKSGAYLHVTTRIPMSIELINSVGQVVATSTIDRSTGFRIPMGLAAGVYYARLRSDSVYSVQKIVLE